jgi:predicted O-methyltransferase YrrM
MINYTQIPGWFSEEAFYDRVVDSAPDDATFVEIGCWLGKSTCYLAQHIKASNKRIRLFAVDTWKGSGNEPDMLHAVAQAGGSVLDLFQKNMEAAGVLDQVNCLVSDSVSAAEQFGTATCDFVFIDADHSYEAVKADILAWAPKVKPGGILAGHDICTYNSVQRAVVDCLGEYQCTGNVWFRIM